MEAHKEHKLSDEVASGIAKQTSSNEDVQALDIFAAIREILQSILCQSKRAGVHVSIKSKNCQNSLWKTWFYIKVSTKSRVDISVLEDEMMHPALFTTLKYMQCLENESHLCIQNPFNDIEGEGQGSVQQNLILEGQRLNILHEVTRSKNMKDSSVHLRVHQPLWHMMKECTQIHNYLAQTRLFRPRVELSFTMKVGEAVSQSNFRVQSKKKLSQTIPSIVTDSVFFLQDSDVTAVSETVTPYTVDPVLVRTQCLNKQNEYMCCSVHMSPVASYIPVEDGGSSIVTLTWYGPGCLPLGTTGTCAFLEDVDWSKYGLAMDTGVTANRFKGLLPHHANVVLKSSQSGCNIDPFILPIFILLQIQLDTDDVALGYQLTERNIDSLLKEHKSELLGLLQTTLDKVLLPVLHNAKNRWLVVRSINSICKAVTDVVSMSSNERFRSSVLQCMKVADTVDLKEELKHQLTDISHKKHHGVWNRSSYSKVTGRKDLKGISRDREDYTTDVIGQEEVDVDSWCTAGGEDIDQDETYDRAESQAIPEDHSKVNYDKENDTRRENFHFTDEDLASQSCVVTYPLCASKFQNATDSDGDEFYDRSGTGRLKTKLNNQDKTPDMSQNLMIEDMDKVSPFHQLADDSPIVEMDMTPDVSEITQGMKDVSPFQELASDDKMGSDSLQAISEDPCEGQVVPESLADWEMPFTKYSLEPNAEHTSQKDEGSVMVYCNGSALPTKSRQASDKHNPMCLDIEQTTHHDSTRLYNSRFKAPFSQLDFELLSSEDFGPTLEVVSNFIDEMSSFGESQYVTSVFQNAENPVECVGKDSHMHEADDNEKRKRATAGKDSKCLEEDTRLSTASESSKGNTCSKHEDILEEGAGNEITVDEGKITDLDDWFNDVLMEAGDWLS